MFILYEKAEEEVLKKCKEFITLNRDSEKVHSIYSEALHLSTELMISVLKSHKEFNDFIKNRIDSINELDDGPEKDYQIFKFNSEYNHIVLDKEAYMVREELEKIQNNNK